MSITFLVLLLCWIHFNR